MGAGKSTLGRALAARRGVAFVDLDEAVQAREGASPAQIFATAGEAAFRDAEARALEAALASREVVDGAVVALGGGAVLRARSRRALLEAGVLVTLHAEPAVLAARVEGDPGRPLLAGRDPAEALAELLDARADAYAECHGAVDTGRLDAAAALEAIERIADEDALVVPLGRRSYRVRFGAGVIADPTVVGELASLGDRLVMVTDANVEPLWAAPLAARLAAKVAARVVLPAGEAHKTIESVARVWDAALGAHVDRGAAVVAVGGGVVGDLAGFAASTLLRGLPWALVPTTLVAIADSSVGGKTGFDRPQGKNLVGTVHQPRLVVCDVATLATLDDAERIGGLAEVVKAAMLDGEDALGALEADADGLRRGDVEATLRAARRAVALKARIVAADEHERQGLRVALNLGHTVGHALEADSGYAMRHGEAVSLGLVAALRVAAGLGALQPGYDARVADLLRALGLPTDLDARLRPSTLAWVASDKKRASGAVRFVVPLGPGVWRLEPLTVDALAGLVAAANL
jgi:shikimate kinase/3-dehydroquinate synthase